MGRKMEPVGSSEAEFLLLRLNRTPDRPDDFGYQVLTAGAGGFFILGTVLLMPLKTTGRGPISSDTIPPPVP